MSSCIGQDPVNLYFERSLLINLCGIWDDLFPVDLSFFHRGIIQRAIQKLRSFKSGQGSSLKSK